METKKEDRYLANSIDYHFGRYIAQSYSSDIAPMLKSIYFGYVEPLHVVPATALGIIDEVSTWNYISVEAKEWLGKIKAVMDTHIDEIHTVGLAFN